MTIDLNIITAFIGAMATILAPILVILKKYNHIVKQIDKIDNWNKKQQQDIFDIKDNDLAQNKALLAMARSMKDKGYNHTIDSAIDTLEHLILAQQAHSKSYEK